MRRTAALIALVAMASSSTAALAHGRTRATAVVVESALGKVDSVTTGHAGFVCWTQKDPLGFAAGDTSLYVYALGDPVTYVDPDGEFAVLPFIIAGMYIYNAYDTYQTAKKLMDPCVSNDDKLAEVALLGAQWLGGALLGKGLKALRAAAKTGCFVAGTLVLTAAAGPIAIEAIEPGMAVIARDPATGNSVERVVTAVHVRPDVPTLALGIESDGVGSSVLTTTAEHPLWSATAGGFVQAAAIVPGDWLMTADGEWAYVTSSAYTGRTETVYNLTVDDAESYYVGEAGVLAHNTPICWKSSKQFGHTFKEHGAGAKRTQSLTDRGRDRGTPQGQWLDNQKAAEFLADQKIDGPASVPIPPGLGQVIKPGGAIEPASWATLYPSATGLETAFPILAR